MALLKSVRDFHAQKRRSLLALARCAPLAGALGVAGPVFADSDRPNVANGTGDDPTQPVGKIELLDRYTEAPGPGVGRPTEHIVISAEFGIPIIKDFPVYTFKTQLRVGYLF
jgi:hypothetical protein